MRHTLKRHPDSRCSAVESLAVEIARPRNSNLSLTFLLKGEIAGLHIPALADPARRDGLWRHTCFEAFVGPSRDPSYVELNFAPSGEWAAYKFSGYRTGMEPLEIRKPAIAVLSTASELRLTAEIDLAPLPPGLPWKAGLSAIIEEAGGRISYWALTHPQGKPDFHHSDCFALEISPPSRP